MTRGLAISVCVQSGVECRQGGLKQTGIGGFFEAQANYSLLQNTPYSILGWPILTSNCSVCCAIIIICYLSVVPQIVSLLHEALVCASSAWVAALHSFHSWPSYRDCSRELRSVIFVVESFDHMTTLFGAVGTA